MGIKEEISDWPGLGDSKTNLTVSNASPSAPDPDKKRLAEAFWRVESLLLRRGGAPGS